MSSGNLVVAAACAECLTGVGLIVQPALVVRLLFGEDLGGIGLAVARVAGLGLLSLGVACWPRPEATAPALRALLVYNALTAAYLTYLWLFREVDGTLLIPVIAIHALFTLLFARMSLRPNAPGRR
jgi:hypothetical protein